MVVVPSRVGVSKGLAILRLLHAGAQVAILLNPLRSIVLPFPSFTLHAFPPFTFKKREGEDRGRERRRQDCRLEKAGLSSSQRDGYTHSPRRWLALGALVPRTQDSAHPHEQVRSLPLPREVKLTIYRPQQLNAMTDEVRSLSWSQNAPDARLQQMEEDMRRVLDWAEEETGIWVVVVTGSSPAAPPFAEYPLTSCYAGTGRIFCAGQDRKSVV